MTRLSTLFNVIAVSVPLLMSPSEATVVGFDMIADGRYWWGSSWTHKPSHGDTGSCVCFTRTMKNTGLVSVSCLRNGVRFPNHGDQTFVSIGDVDWNYPIEISTLGSDALWVDRFQVAHGGGHRYFGGSNTSGYCLSTERNNINFDRHVSVGDKHCSSHFALWNDGEIYGVMGGSTCATGCSTWFDGCNTCSCYNGEPSFCTRMFCNTERAPRCLDNRGEQGNVYYADRYVNGRYYSAADITGRAEASCGQGRRMEVEDVQQMVDSPSVALIDTEAAGTHDELVEMGSGDSGVSPMTSQGIRELHQAIRDMAASGGVPTDSEIDALLNEVVLTDEHRQEAQETAGPLVTETGSGFGGDLVDIDSDAYDAPLSSEGIRELHQVIRDLTASGDVPTDGEIDALLNDVVLTDEHRQEALEHDGEVQFEKMVAPQ